MSQYSPPSFFAPFTYYTEGEEEDSNRGTSSTVQTEQKTGNISDSSSVSSESSDASSASASSSASSSASASSPVSGETDDDINPLTTFYKNTIARHLDDPRYAIIRSADGTINTSNLSDYSHLVQMNSIYTPHTPTSNSLLYFNPKKRVNSTLFSFKSGNRDKTVYPSQAYFTLKTPRVYKNVTQVQLVQISFQYFLNNIADISQSFVELINLIALEYGQDSSECLACFNGSSVQNNGIAIQEFGRFNPTTLTNPLPSPLTHTFVMRSGAYDANTLVEELNQQMNRTPPFRIISYTDHRNQFHTTKSLNHLFNNPAGAFIHRTVGSNISVGRSKHDFIGHYFGSGTGTDLDRGGTLSHHPTEQEIFTAYYFPVLKETVADKFLNRYLDIGTAASINEVEQRVIHSFEGLTSPFYLQLCSTNRTYLHTIRRSYTFEYAPVNRYEWEFNPTINRIGVRHTELHPAIRSDITEYHATKHSQAVNRIGHTPASFSILQQDNNKTKAILTDLHRIINNALSTINIPFGIYSAAYFGSNTNYISSSTGGVGLGGELDSHLISLALGNITAPTVPGGPIPARGTTSLGFGWTTLAELSTESTFPGGYTYTAPYQSTLTALNTASGTASIVGSNYINGYGGVGISATGFSSLYSTFLSYYATYSSNISTVNTVVGSVNGATSNYVHGTYGSVLPAAVIGNSCNINGEYLRLGAVPEVQLLAGENVVFPSTPFETTVGAEENSCCKLIKAFLGNIYACLPPGTIRNSVFNKLGFDLANITSLYSTLAVDDPLTTFNVYLQMNIDRSMNNMDVAKDENFNVTNESTGDTKLVLGKLLTEGSGLQDITQTIIQQPARFDPPLGKLDKFEFQLLLDDGVPINKLFPFELAGSDWDAVIQIDEEVPTLDRDVDLTTVPTVEWPVDQRPY